MLNSESPLSSTCRDRRALCNPKSITQYNEYLEHTTAALLATVVWLFRHLLESAKSFDDLETIVRGDFGGKKVVAVSGSDPRSCDCWSNLADRVEFFDASPSAPLPAVDLSGGRTVILYLGPGRHGLTRPFQVGVDVIADAFRQGPTRPAQWLVLMDSDFQFTSQIAINTVHEFVKTAGDDPGWVMIPQRPIRYLRSSLALVIEDFEKVCLYTALAKMPATTIRSWQQEMPDPFPGFFVISSQACSALAAGAALCPVSATAPRASTTAAGYASDFEPRFWCVDFALLHFLASWAVRIKCPAVESQVQPESALNDALSSLRLSEAIKALGLDLNAVIDEFRQNADRWLGEDTKAANHCNTKEECRVVVDFALHCLRLTEQACSSRNGAARTGRFCSLS